MTADEYIALREGRGGRVQRERDGWKVECPAHDSASRASLHVTEAADRVLVHCFAGCNPADILAADGLTVADLFHERRNGRTEVAAYQYTDEAGTLLFEVVRFAPKDFRQRRPDGSGGWIWKLGNTRRVPYRLPRVIEAVVANRPVFVVEGEEDVHALERAGQVATCNPAGAGKWRDEYAEPLRGATVYVVADRDEPGREHAADVARSLQAVSATVLRMEAAVGKDARDHLQAGKTIADFVLVEDTEPEPGPSSPVKLRVLDTHRLVETDPPPLDWLADGIFARGGLTLFGGREKGGKSLVQAAIAVTMASGGGMVAGIPVKGGKVLVVDAENGEREIHRRIRALGLAVEHADNLVFVEARGFNLSTDLALLLALLDEHRPDLLLLDSFRALWLGDERDEAQVAGALDPLRTLVHDRDMAAGLTHHAQKGGDEYRGSTAIGAAVEWVVMLSRAREDPDRTRRCLTNPLGRFAPEREDRWLTIRADGDEGPVSIVAADPFVPERDAPMREEVEGMLMSYFDDACQLASPYIGGGKVASGWTASDLAREIGRPPTDGTVHRAVKRLADHGVLYRGEDKRWHLAPAFDFGSNGRPDFEEGE